MILHVRAHRIKKSFVALETSFLTSLHLHFSEKSIHLISQWPPRNNLIVPLKARKGSRGRSCSSVKASSDSVNLKLRNYEPDGVIYQAISCREHF